MTAAALLGVAGSGRSAPSAAHPQPYRYRGGMSAKPAADLPQMCAIFVCQKCAIFVCP